MCERNKGNIRILRLQNWKQIWSVLLKRVTCLYWCLNSAPEHGFEANLPVVPSWSALVHIVEWCQEYMNPVSFRWTCTRTLPYTSGTPTVNGHSVHGAIRGLVWVKAPWNVDNGDIGFSALIDLACKSTPIELHYLLIWTQIYKPSKEKQTATLYIIYQKRLQTLNWSTDGLQNLTEKKHLATQNHKKEECHKQWEKMREEIEIA